MPYLYDNRNPGVIPVGKQDTSHVAEEVLKEQQHGDEFNPPEPAEIQKLRDRLEEIRGEIGELYREMYPPMKVYDPSKGPDYKRMADLKQRMTALEKEEGGIQSYLRQVYEAFDGASGQTGVPAGPFGGSAIKIVGED